MGGLVYGWSCLSSSVRNMMYMYSLCMRVYVLKVCLFVHTYHRTMS